MPTRPSSVPYASMPSRLGCHTNWMDNEEILQIVKVTALTVNNLHETTATYNNNTRALLRLERTMNLLCH